MFLFLYLFFYRLGLVDIQDDCLNKLSPTRALYMASIAVIVTRYLWVSGAFLWRQH